MGIDWERMDEHEIERLVDVFANVILKYGPTVLEMVEQEEKEKNGVSEI